MTRITTLSALVGLLAFAGCSDRKVDPAASVPSVEEVCDAVCIVYDRCWDLDEDNPYSSIPECVADCNFLYYAWPYDPDQRYECADVILDLQWCYANLATCEEFDASGGQPGKPCDLEFSAYSDNGCIGGPDPRDYVDTDSEG